ncbi:SH3 type 3 domain-containing protein [Brucella abortus bv. 4 str. 292]|uniref:Uncharacterized protein n=4 Tax=Brucella TaxID=234 RepID=A0A0H3AND8_BRUO2|nr:conserved hypothetical protein [Brucella ovis ATCC 25840]EEW80509.1 SH3 type 3 domain-containing protein [Brucella abortus NCTC 8038]EEW88436.1 SH3 type 3 domain-containing protein [Brucella melitensis bv. 1 str. 16M]EEX56603.1 SH3 type 3 domain-containing protein [Brucella abortus bv. 4 str. 292]EEX58319.1 SH3 type 3 domain-containing protein [Brucella abortus bv. 2 str. 86/8/59]EEX63050.1 SH3 type 3 domain-containing protein [Brucella abortus bv. 6 str. 870]EEX81739.1 SH3 type 3 domain-c
MIFPGIGGPRLSKAKNWIFGAAALFVLAKVFGNDKPSPVPPSIPVAPQAATQPAEQAPQPLGFIQATSPRQTDQPPARGLPTSLHWKMALFDCKGKHAVRTFNIGARHHSYRPRENRQGSELPLWVV